MEENTQYFDAYEENLLNELVRTVSSLGMLDGQLLNSEDIDQKWKEWAPEYIAEARKDFVEYYTEHIDHKTVPYEGMHEVLRRLSKEGVTLAVASNKFHAGTERLIERFFADVEFASVHGNRDGFPLKPDAAVLKLIMEECGFEPQQCCMIGDSGVDMQTAINAGVDAVGVTWGFRPRAELEGFCPKGLIDGAEELLRFV